MTAPSDPFDAASSLADARAARGLADFGDDAFREPLRVLLASLEDAPLNAVGVWLLGSSVVWSLASRLRARYWFTQHPVKRTNDRPVARAPGILAETLLFRPQPPVYS